MSKCIVCNINSPKYKCPQCELSTCSLPCVQIHKQEIKCSGVRRKTSYIPLNKFDNLSLLNDYRFLEEVSRNVDSCKRNPLKRYTRFMQPLPTHLYRLKSASERRKTHLQFLPQHFTRHQQNNTYLDYATQIIYWRLELVFPQGNLTKIGELVDENTKLSKVLHAYVNAISCPDLYKDELRFYHSAGLTDIEVLLKADRVKEPNSFYLIDIDYTLKENLTNKVIIENPIIYVIRKGYKNEYNILDDNDSVNSSPFEIVHGKKSGFFGDFSPVGYFDDLRKLERKESEGDIAMGAIARQAAILRGSSDKYQTLNDEQSDEEVAYHRKLEIPSYYSL